LHWAAAKHQVLQLPPFCGSSTVCDKSLQKNKRNRKTDLKKTGILPGVKYAKTRLNGPVGQKWTQWTFGVIENKIVHPVYQVHLVYKMPVPEISSGKSI
jgi:hypothetical protein